jgi:16S rRNA (uracil1498-N3)-methyltransferase
MPHSPRFYVDGEIRAGAQLNLPRDVAHHALRVLRLAAGATVTVFNGLGGEFEGRLEPDGKHDARVHIERHDDREAELAFQISIGQGLCAAEKMDWLIEKSVELGATALAPLALRKSVVKLSDERAQKRALHWQQLIVAASQQCGRNRLMRIDAATDLGHWLTAGEATGHRLVLAPGSDTTLADFARQTKPGSTQLLVGPEGGLGAEELQAARAAGFTAVGLGPRILRTETAAMVALTTLTTLWDC